jgi:two-component system sensor histidine kinase SenX3
MPTYDGGELSGAVVVIEDVTLTQEVDRVRKDFVANVSHELRTPIGAIGLLAETLRGSDDPEVIDRLAGRLHSEALRLGDMIDDLLALSKLESGQIEEPEVMDLRQVVSLATDRAVAAAEQRKIRIPPRVPGGPVQIVGDQGHMVSAVATLLDNAVKYSDEGAEVTVTIDAVGDETTITVTDTGVGIPEAALKRIFERFYRVDDARSRTTGGTGLGLSIVRHVVLNHRGTIAVVSTEGQGSSFTMRLPRTITGRDEISPTTPSPTTPSPTTPSATPPGPPGGPPSGGLASE